jgi:hypothetical protein
MADLQKLDTPANPLYSLLQAAPNLVNLFADKTTTQSTSGGTQSTQLQLTPDAVTAMINKLMQGTSGLAATASGQKGVGLYNSSTNQLLVNDLLAKVATETAAKAAPTVTTTSPQTSTNVAKAQVDPMMTALGIGGSIVGKKLLKSIIDGGSSTAASAATAAAGDLSGTILNAGGSDLASSIGGLDFIGNVASAGDIGNTISSLVGGGDLLSSFLGGDLLSSASSMLDVGSALGSGLDLGTSIFGDLGSSFGSLDFLGGNAATSALGSAGAVLGPVGIALDVSSLLGGPSLGDVLGGVGDMVEGLNPSVICTELYKQGLIPKDVYRLDNSYGRYHVSKTVLTGYHFWAVPFTKLMMKSKLVTTLASWLAIPWAKEIAHKMDKSYPSNYLGKIVYYHGIPLCWVIGKLVITFKGKDKSCLI